MEKAVVLLSGGLDSATCLAIARSRGFECFSLSFDYGQRHKCELEAARRAMAGKLRSLSRENDLRKKREKLFRFMANRGFSPAVIFKLVNETVDE